MQARTAPLLHAARGLLLTCVTAGLLAWWSVPNTSHAQGSAPDLSRPPEAGSSAQVANERLVRFQPGTPLTLDTSLRAKNHRYVIFVAGIRTGSQLHNEGAIDTFANVLPQARRRLGNDTQFFYMSYGCSPPCTGASWLALANGRPDFRRPRYDEAATKVPLATHSPVMDALVNAIATEDSSAVIDIIVYSLGGPVTYTWASSASAKSLSRVHRVLSIDSPLAGIEQDAARNPIVRPLFGDVVDELASAAAVSRWLKAIDRVDVSDVLNFYDPIVNGNSMDALIFPSAVGRGLSLIKTRPQEALRGTEIPARLTSARQHDFITTTICAREERWGPFYVAKNHATILGKEGCDSSKPLGELLARLSEDGPLWLARGRSGEIPESTTVLVMDVSGSMGDQFRGRRKLDGAKDAAGNILQMIKDEAVGGRADHRAALVTFSSQASTVAPLTADLEALSGAVTRLSTAGGTNVGAGLAAGVRQIQEQGPRTADAKRVLILLSDGKSTDGLSRDQILAGPVAEAQQAGICIYTIGFGEAADLDEALLRGVASRSGCGEYFHATDAGRLSAIYVKLRHQSLGDVVGEFSGRITQGQRLNAGSFAVGPRQSQLLATLNWPGSRLELRLTDPTGKVVDEKYPGAQVQSSARLVTTVISNPIAGEWRAEAIGADVPQGGTTYDVLVSTRLASSAPHAQLPYDVVAGAGIAVCVLAGLGFLLTRVNHARRDTVFASSSGEATSSSPLSVSSSATSVAASIELRVCLRCGLEALPGIFVCPACSGTAFRAVPADSQLCLACQAIVAITSRFCSACGSPLGQAAHASAVSTPAAPDLPHSP